MYDVIVIGGGAAGLSAAIYSGRYGRKTLVIKGEGFEGSTIETWEVENYPGHLKINGPDLVDILEQQAKNTGAELTEGHIKNITHNNHIFNVFYNNHCQEAKTIIYAAGTQRRKLGLPNEEKLKGRGVTYCATCDGPLFRGKIVGVVGGGDSAVKAALILAQYTEKVYIIARETELMAEPINIKSLKGNKKVEVILNTKIEELLEQDGRLSGVKFGNNHKTLDLSGLFVEIGGMANIEPIKHLNLHLDREGYIHVNPVGETSLLGFFAAGDVTDAFHGFRQIVTAAAGGSAAAFAAHNYLTKHHIK